MDSKYKGRFELQYWLRRIELLIKRINEISTLNIDLEKELDICVFQGEDYTIATYFYYSNLYKKILKNVLSN